MDRGVEAGMAYGGRGDAAVCAATEGWVGKAAYEAWLAGKGLAASAYPQEATGANGAANWVNYCWDIEPTSTNALRIVGLAFAPDGAMLLQVPSASPYRHYWLRYATNLSVPAPANAYLGPGTPVMTNGTGGASTWFGGLMVRDTPLEEWSASRNGNLPIGH